jgi:putative tryptophan/tyrosine transport system substrate-binding protein
MISRRDLLVVLGASALSAPLACFAQPQDKVWRIGMLETVSPELNAANLAAFRQALRELGYVEGRNLVIEYRSADGRSERFPGLAAELVGLKVDLIVARGTPASLASKNATRTTPVIMTAAGDPVDTGLVPSLAHPGGNVTGLSSVAINLEAKRLGLLRELVPGMARIAALYDMSSRPGNPLQWKEIETAARALGVQPQLLDARKPEDLGPAFDAASRQRADGLVVGQQGLFQANRQLIVELAAKHRLPAIYRSMDFIEAGGLMAYGPSYPDLYRRAASYVDKIFRGAKPSDLPIEQPTKFELIINLKTAKALGLTIPPPLLLRADEVIQ